MIHSIFYSILFYSIVTVVAHHYHRRHRHPPSPSSSTTDVSLTVAYHHDLVDCCLVCLTLLSTVAASSNNVIVTIIIIVTKVHERSRHCQNAQINPCHPAWSWWVCKVFGRVVRRASVSHGCIVFVLTQTKIEFSSTTPKSFQRASKSSCILAITPWQQLVLLFVVPQPRLISSFIIQSNSPRRSLAKDEVNIGSYIACEMTHRNWG